jgi:hypothetical protein
MRDRGKNSRLQEETMKTLLGAVALATLTIGAVHAQSMNKMDNPKQQSPGTTGAMGNVNANGVATDPGGVQAQQGGSTNASPGTVGAAPGADTKSQKPKS